MPRFAIAFFVLLFCASTFASPRPFWTPNDLSILLPLPTELENDGLIRASDLGTGPNAKGSLIPWSNFQSLPPLAPLLHKYEDAYKALRAIGFRIDPCFPGKQGCIRQIRLVWQPLVLHPVSKKVLTVDAAMHTFYDLSEIEYTNLLADLAKLKASSGVATDGPLWVHPAYLQQGLQGAFAKGFRSLVLSKISERNLSRLTFMIMRGDSILWGFGGINFDIFNNGVATTISIPRLEKSADRPAVLQSFINRSFSTDDFRQSDVRPAPEGADTFNLLMRDSGAIRPVEDQKELHENLAAIYRLENPSVHNSETADCVSCHVAQPARGYALGKFGQLGFPSSIHDLAYKSKFDLRNVSAQAWFTTNLHAFSYFQEEPALSQRTINEAAAVATMVNSESL